MNHERKRLFNLGLAIAVLAVAVLPNLSSETPQALSSVFFNTPVNCTEIGLNEQRDVLLPGSWYHIDQDNKRYPDQAQKERLEAVADYWEKNKNNITGIYLLDGIANDGTDFNTGHLLSIEPSIPRSIIHVDYKSFDTHSNMAEAKKLITPESKAVVITHPSHLDRAVFDACIRGIKAIGVAAETVQDSATIKIEKAKLFVTALLDRGGLISAWYKNNVK